MEEISRLVGSKIREIRNRLGLTQEEVAERAGMDFTSIGAAERGVRNLSLKSLFKVAKALGVPIEELVRSPKETPLDKEKELAISKLQELIRDTEIDQLKFLTEVAQIAHDYTKKMKRQT